MSSIHSIATCTPAGSRRGSSRGGWPTASPTSAWCRARTPRSCRTVPTPRCAASGSAGSSTTTEPARAKAGSSSGSGLAWRSACRARRWRTSGTCCHRSGLSAESYVTFCKTRPWVQACASSLTELFAPKIHAQRIEAFPVHYPWIPPEALDYFKSRLVQAPRDVQPGSPSCSSTARPSKPSAGRSRRSPSSWRCSGP